MPAPETLSTPKKTVARLPEPSKSRRLLLPLPLETFAQRASTSKSRPLFTLSEGRGRFGRPRPKPVRGLPGTRPRVTQESPESTQRRLRRLIHQLARKIQDRRLAGAAALPAISPRSVKPGATPGTSESPRNGTPPTSPPNPAQSAPSTLLRRLVADCPAPPQQRKVRA